jgi:peptide deformylase
MKILEFGEPLLRQKAKKILPEELKSGKPQAAISDMYEFLSSKKLGVGLAAPQVGLDLSLAIILIQPTKHRSKVKDMKLAIINPEIVNTYGRRSRMWEGCISGGPAKSSLFARVPRYKKLDLSYLDEQGRKHKKTFEGLPAQVIQHEVDHLNGILFVDRVKDSRSFITHSQYLKLVKTKRLSDVEK